MTHKLLERHLRQHGLTVDAPPDAEAWRAFLESAGGALQDAETRAETAGRFRRLLDRGGAAILVAEVAGGGLIADLNESAERMLGMGREALMRTRLPELVRPVAPEGGPGPGGDWSALVGALEASGGSVARESELTRPDGSVLPVEVTFSLSYVEERAYIVAVALDASVRHELQRQVDDERGRAAFAARLAMLGEMAGGVAHEINNPLTIVDGYGRKLELLTQRFAEVPAEEVLKLAGSIRKVVDRIARIVRGLRVFSRDASCDPFEATPLATIVEDTLALCQEKLRHAEIDVRVALPEGPLAIECRSTQICQVLLNLMQNARDAVELLPERWLELKVEDRGPLVALIVTDSGGGISPLIRDRIMQPFFTTKGVGKGTGLGLSISKGIVEEHKGRLLYDDSSRNTRFVVFLPKAAA